MPLTIPADLYPLIPGMSAGEDAALISLLLAVEASVATRLGIPAAAAGGSAVLDDVAHTFFLDGASRREPSKIRIPVQPVQSITSIHDDPNWDYGTDELVDSGEYTLDGATGEVWINPTASHGWSRARRAIKVIAVCGWTSAPEDLKRGILLWAAMAWSQNSGAISRDSQNAGPGRTRWRLPVIPEEAATLIDAFKVYGSEL